MRLVAATAAVPAAGVVIGHLAWAWHQNGDVAQRQSLAFDHGVALAVILALVLAAGRIAAALERGGHPVADCLAVAGVIAVLAHLAATWRDEGMDVTSVRVVLEHLAALALVALATVLVRRLERARA